MVRHTEHGSTQLKGNSQTYGVLLDELADLICRGKEADVEAFIAEHPSHEEQLRGMVPTVRAIVMLGGSQEELDGDHPRAGRNKALGDFRIIRQIGRGGMGVVYEAEQVSLPRRVALKVLPYAGMLDPRQLERFKNESRAAATLDHPGIVSVYSVGCVRAIHFYALQYVEGQSLAEVITQLRGEREATAEASRMSQLTKDFVSGDFVSGSTNGEATKKTVDQAADSTMRSAAAGSTSSTPLGAVGTIVSRAFMQSVARLGIQVAEALDHAHARGIVHRDIKPGNLLLDTEGNVKVADFGLARFEADAGVTMTGDIVGTLRYMSPEQALAKRVVVDHRTDVYSLGVTLYELLTLRPPFSGNDRRILLRQIAFDEPTAPRKLNRAIPAELETIILKAIAKEPNDRYDTAQDFAEDLRRYLAGRPILARRTTLSEHTWRLVKRNPVISSLTALLLIVTTFTAVGGWTHAEKLRVALTRTEELRSAATKQRDKMEVAKKQSERLLYMTRMRLASEELGRGGLKMAKGILDMYNEGDARKHRDFAWFCLTQRLLSVQDMTLQEPVPGTKVVYDLQYAADSNSVLGGSQDGHLIVWDANTGERRHKVGRHTACLNSIAVSPRGDLLATASCDGSVKIWSWPELSVLKSLFEHQAPVLCVSFSPSGTKIATGSKDGGVRLWETQSCKLLGQVADHKRQVHAVALSPDGRFIASGGDDGTVRIVDRSDLKEVVRIRQPSWVTRLVFRPDGEQLFVGHGNGFSLLDGNDFSTIAAEGSSRISAVKDANWTLDSRQLVVGYRVGRISLFNATNLKMIAGPSREEEHLFSVRISPDGSQIAIASLDGSVNCRNAQDLVSTRSVSPAVPIVAASSKTASIVPEGSDGVAVDAGRLIASIASEGDNFKTSIAPELVTPDPSLFLSADTEVLATQRGHLEGYHVWRVDTSSGKIEHVRHSQGNVICMSPDGQLLVVRASIEGDLRSRRYKLIGTQDDQVSIPLVTRLNNGFPPNQAAFSENGQTLAITTDNGVDVWDVRMHQDIRKVHTLPVRGHFMCVTISSECNMLAAADVSGNVSIWGLSDESPVRSLFWIREKVRDLGNGADWITAMSFSPDGQSIAVSSGRHVTVWDVTNGEKYLTLFVGSEGKGIDGVGFSNGGSTLTAWYRGSQSRSGEISAPCVWRWGAAR